MYTVMRGRRRRWFGLYLSETWPAHLLNLVEEICDWGPRWLEAQKAGVPAPVAVPIVEEISMALLLHTCAPLATEILLLFYIAYPQTAFAEFFEGIPSRE